MIAAPAEREALATDRVDTRLAAFIERVAERGWHWDRARSIEADAQAELRALRDRVDPAALCGALGRGQTLGVLLASSTALLARELLAASGGAFDPRLELTCAAPWSSVPQLSFVPDRDGYLVTGTCALVVEAEHCEHVLVRTAPASWALLPLHGPNIELKRSPVDGFGCAGLNRVAWSSVRIDASRVARIAEADLERVRVEHLLRIAHGLCSYARRLFDLTLQFTGARAFRGGKLADLAVVRHRLADLAVYPRVFEAQLNAVEHACEHRELHALLLGESLSCQLSAFVKQCQQLHGGRGFLSDHPLARAYRDCLQLALLLGSSAERRAAIAARSSELEHVSRASAGLGAADHAAFRARARAAIAEHIRVRRANQPCDAGSMAELHAEFARKRLTTVRLGREQGGGGKDFSYSVILAEELIGAADAGVAVSLMIAAGAVVPLLEREAAPSLRAKLWPQLRTGKAVLAFGITEPGGGSDLLHALDTRATLDGDSWVLNGRKMFITNGPIADYVLVLARTSDRPGPFHASFLAVPVAADGVTVSEPYETLGLRSSPTGYIEFRNVRVARDHVIGRPGLGMHYLADSISEERTLIAVGALRLASRLVHDALLRTDRWQRLLPWIARLAGLQALAAANARSIASGERDHAAAALIKLAACEAAQEAIECAAEVVGHDEPEWQEPVYAQALRDSRVLTVFAGTTETLRELVGASVAARARLAGKALAS